MRWTLRATALVLAVALPLAAGAAFKLWLGTVPAPLAATLGALLGAWLVIGQATRHELAERFLFITGDTASTEAWRFLQDTRVPVLEKPFTAQARLRAVEQVSA